MVNIKGRWYESAVTQTNWPEQPAIDRQLLTIRSLLPDRAVPPLVATVIRRFGPELVLTGQRWIGRASDGSQHVFP